MDSEPVIYKCTLIAGGGILQMDVIKHEGKHWLVPNWFENKDEGWQTPERIVLLDVIPHRQMPDNQAWQFLIEFPVPRELFFDPDPSKAGKQFVVQMMPGIRLPLARKLN